MEELETRVHTLQDKVSQCLPDEFAQWYKLHFVY